MRGALAAAARGEAAQIEIMIPLVAYAEELRRMRELVEEVVAAELEQAGRELEISIGTMIELPRAALRAGEIAEYADFFSFGTNDLTQTTLGFSRDDAESAFLATYLEAGVIERNPFASIDVDGVGELVRIGVERGRAARPGHQARHLRRARRRSRPRWRSSTRAGLDYVSCSPFRVPIARLAAARAALGATGDAVSEPAIDAALTPGEALEPCGVAIVVDTIRATTTALYALRQGYARGHLLRRASRTPARRPPRSAPAAILAGERECVRIEGFHLGNSPREFDAGQPLGDVLVLTTTNGTRAVLQAQAEAPVVLVGALANLSATAAHAARLTRGDRGRVAVRCAGRARVGRARRRLHRRPPRRRDRRLPAGVAGRRRGRAGARERRRLHVGLRRAERVAERARPRAPRT